MTTLRRILITALAVMALSVVASASTIGFQLTTTLAPTDITNAVLNLTGWDPGDQSNTTTSNVSGGSGGNAYSTGISMASLDATNTVYTLTGFNISVVETLSGNYTITAGVNGAQGSVFIDTYSAVANGSTLSPALSQGVDPNNDLYNCTATGIGATSSSPPCSGSHHGQNGPATLGGGPDASSPVNSSLNLTSDQSENFSAAGSTGWVDLGCEIQNTTSCAEGSIGNLTVENELSTGFGAVTAASLPFYLSTLTTTDTDLTSGDSTTTFATSVQESVVVTYTYTSGLAPSTPEPTTMALMGGALLGLGLMRKRLKKS